MTLLPNLKKELEHSIIIIFLEVKSYVSFLLILIFELIFFIAVCINTTFLIIFCNFLCICESIGFLKSN